jgi:polysaccharide biosynthesis protein PslG
MLSPLVCAQDAHAAADAQGRLLGGPGLAPRSFYGVMAADDPTSAEAARMEAGGVGTLRITLVWAWVQPDSSTEYDWAHYDQVIGDAARNGIQVLPTIYGSPSWAAVRQNYPPWGQGNVEAFRAFASAAAQRYGANGIFWAAHPEIPRLPVIWWQLWNEVSSSNFWDATPKAKEYVDLLRVFREGIKQGDPSGKILLAGLFPAPIAPNSIPFLPYLRALYKAGARRLFDGAALHPYSTTPQIALQRVRAMRRLMTRYGDRRKPIWITEIGWPTAGLPGSATVSPEQQAIYLVNTYRKLAAARKRLKIAGVVWFSFRDMGGWIWFDHCGLLTTRLDPKLSWASFVSLTGGGS